VQRVVVKTLSRIFPSGGSSVTISAVAIAEIVNSTGPSPQPCFFLALQPNAAGVNDVTLTGSASINSTNCSIRSNGGINLTGSSSLNVNGTYAGGAITFPGWNPGAIQGKTVANAGQIPDPYATNAPLQSALSLLSGGAGVADPNTSYGSTTLNPGTYKSLSLGGSSNVTLTPGTYIVNGNVSFNGAATINGTNVTIIFSGTLADGGSAAVSITAPTTASGVGVPGILLAGTSTTGSSFSGAASLPLTGVVYYPNGNLSFSGSADSTGTNCSEVIAATISISGASNLSASGCSNFGTVPFSSLPNATSIALVQ
jgi:hypothetical protein